ncbi:MAG TPA: DUF3024 domain-containing protein [Rhodocyclaceae bacterium]|nr:DUF3024 domain-containing protein [Rhodocyclaceae bacterium]
MPRAQPRPAPAVGPGTSAGATPPNELDRRRIMRALELRARYRYVSPQLEEEADGFRIVSQCCSRKVDPEGGTIDIARLQYDAQVAVWHLYSKNHATLEWVPQADGRLHELLELLRQDPDRVFWQ